MRRKGQDGIKTMVREDWGFILWVEWLPQVDKFLADRGPKNKSTGVPDSPPMTHTTLAAKFRNRSVGVRQKGA
jgi:hypothetical protein